MPIQTTNTAVDVGCLIPDAEECSEKNEPVENVHIFLQKMNRSRLQKRKRYTIAFIQATKIYPDYYYSPMLRAEQQEARKDKNM
mmetsp:Transcript_48804/g.81014  ORF Transcript_48804/g.81014 Transcript_48804/m.81014 type:complete len:84 (+) Transcript_48804:2122-2373(+)